MLPVCNDHRIMMQYCFGRRGGAIRLTLQGQKKMKMKYKGKEKVKVSKTLSLIVGMNMSDT